MSDVGPAITPVSTSRDLLSRITSPDLVSRISPPDLASRITPSIGPLQATPAQRTQAFIKEPFYSDVTAQRYAKLDVQTAISTFLHDDQLARERDRNSRRTRAIRPIRVDSSQIRPASVGTTIPLTRAQLRARLGPVPTPKPTLEERITFHPYVPKQHVTLDFHKLSDLDIASIFFSRANATITRLHGLGELVETLTISDEDYAVLDDVISRVAYIKQFASDAGKWSLQDRRSLSWGLGEIGKVKFEAARRRLAEIIRGLKHVVEGGYFDSIRKVDNEYTYIASK